ncbi:MAG: ribonuclease R [Thermoanaerobaculia bacterium]
MDFSNDQTLRSAIVALLRTRGSRVLSIKDITQRLASKTDLGPDRDRVDEEVRAMEREGIIVAVRGKRYSLLEFTPYVAGRIRVHPDGNATIRVPGDAPDVHINRRYVKGAMNGDRVIARVEKSAAREKVVRGKVVVEGEVTRVLEREHRTVVGRFHAAAPPFVRPFDIRLDADILIVEDATLGARDGEMVDVEIEQYGSATMEPRGRIIELLGMIGEPGVDIEVVLRKYHIPHQFPEDVVAEAESIPLEIDPQTISSRTDLRDRTIVTIDGETAKDFDDAVEVTRLENGNYRLGVHIADVAHYVVEGGALDREAFERGTSVYFPGRAVPMLPERLSNGICSLNPRVDRLTFSAEIEITPKGRFVNRRVFKSVIRTVARMTYTDVNAILNDPTPELLARYAPLLDDFRRMHELFEILRARRDARGSIDFDLPEADVLLGEEGQIEAITPSERNVAHRIIEEFMLAANEVVAEELSFAAQPGAFRVHNPPDAQKIDDLREILAEFKYRFRASAEEIRPGELQRVLKDVAGTPEERFLTEFVLRSMKRAFYSEECSGHFALALQYYCHFTSPIRRYPDLIVHRMLARLIEEGPMHGDLLEQTTSRMPMLTVQSSEREKRAEDAEREVLEWKKVIFMRDKVGMEFAGRVTGVVPFGLFVELDEYFVQGLVPVSTIGGDYWDFAEREHRLRGVESGRDFRLGDPVRIEVWEINEDRRQIEFRLVEAGGAAIARRDESGARFRSKKS